jgi:hypothetical protein
MILYVFTSGAPLLDFKAKMTWAPAMPVPLRLMPQPVQPSGLAGEAMNATESEELEEL